MHTHMCAHTHTRAHTNNSPCPSTSSFPFPSTCSSSSAACCCTNVGTADDVEASTVAPTTNMILAHFMPSSAKHLFIFFLCSFSTLPLCLGPFRWKKGRNVVFDTFSSSIVTYKWSYHRNKINGSLSLDDWTLVNVFIFAWTILSVYPPIPPKYFMPFSHFSPCYAIFTISGL